MCISSDGVVEGIAGARRVAWLWKRLRRTETLEGIPLRALVMPAPTARGAGACLSAIVELIDAKAIIGLAAW